MGKIFYLMGKSSSGKDSVFKEIKKRIPELKDIVLYTTRPIREGEREGVEYHFVNEEIKYLILSVCTAVLINFAVEPIMKGMPYYFTVFCIMGGAMRKYVNRIKGRCINNE